MPAWHHTREVVRQGGGRTGPWRGTSIAVAMLFLVVACSGPVQGSKPSASRSSNRIAQATATPTSLSEWQKRGATEVPPADVQRVSLDGISVVNQTSGAVSDGDARTWAGALLRSYAYLLWAVSRGQDRFLLQSGLSSAGPAVFRASINDITLARQAGAGVEYSREVFRRLVLRAVPASMKPTFDAEQFAWKPYAFFLDAVGPITTTWVDGHGGRTVKSQLAPGVAAYELMGGELGHDPLMGEVWVLASDWSCTSASSRQGLAPLCNP